MVGAVSNRAERRELRGRYRRVDVSRKCATCDAALGATFVIERGKPDPSVAFVHNADGTHAPVIAGDGVAARARREGQVIGHINAEVDG